MMVFNAGINNRYWNKSGIGLNEELFFDSERYTILSRSISTVVARSAACIEISRSM